MLLLVNLKENATRCIKKIKGQKAMNYKVDQLLSSKTSNADMSQNVSCTQKMRFCRKNIERNILCVCLITIQNHHIYHRTNKECKAEY